MPSTNFTPLIIVLLLVLAYFVFSMNSCQPRWEKSLISSKEGISSDLQCREWCSGIYNVMTSRIEFSEKDEYGFYSYNCYCDLRDCGNPLKVFR
jgi:hypothetical protein